MGKMSNELLSEEFNSMQNDAARYRFLKRCESLQVDEYDVDGKWEPVGDLDKAIDERLNPEKQPDKG
jgi:hypothetical protein